jgi:glycosyltransferase involved in cell wall biosynthesis
MKNVCFFNSIKFWGGGEKLNLEYANELKRKGYNIILFAAQGSPLWEYAQKAELETYPISIGNLSFLNIFKLIQIGQLFKKHEIDTVIFSNSQDVKAGSIAAHFFSVKNIVYYRSIAVLVKGSFVNKFIFGKTLTHIVTNSDETKRKILEKLADSIDPAKIKTIYYGIDFTKFNSDTRLSLPEIEKNKQGIVLGNAGRLTEQKGQQYLIEIAKNLKAKNLDFTLFIAGKGELEAQLQKEIRTHQLEKHIHLLGFVEDMESFMNSLDIFVLTSMWEGFGYVLAEAMLKSKPVVAFNMTSNPEVVLENKTGLLVDFPNLEMFTDKVSLLIQDADLRTKMGQTGKESIYERFNLEDRVSELEHFILGE